GDIFAARDKHSAVAALPPQRAARLQQLLAHERALESQWNGVQQGKLNYARERSGAASQMREAQFAHWAAGQDQQVEARVPELKGPNAQEFLQAAKSVFHDAGLNDQEIKNALRTPAFRSAPAQLVVCAAARAKLAQQRVAEMRAAAKRKPAPKVQRPGNGSARIGLAGHELSNLSAQLDAASGPAAIRAAARLRAAKRRASERTH